MKNKRFFLTTILVFAMLITFFVPLTSFAEGEKSMEFKTTINTDKYNLGENVRATIGWTITTQGSTSSVTSYNDVQALGFTVQYDNTKLQFVNATYGEVENNAVTEKTLEEDFYNVETPGTIVVAKISLNDLDMAHIRFNFKSIATGAANIKLVDVDCVANGELSSPDSIDYTTKSLATANILVFGDVDSNEKVENADITLINNYIKGTQELTEQQLEVADVNLDGIVDEIDVSLIQESLSSSITLPIRYGDVNLDGGFHILDIMNIQRYLMGEKELSSQALKNADVNLDNIVNDIDYNIMRVAVNGWVNMPYRMIKDKNLKAVDREQVHMITGFDIEKTKVSDLNTQFYTDNGFEVSNNNGDVLENDNVFGTGTKIKIRHFNNSFPNINNESINWLAEYNVVIYGDTTGDGKINAIDALALIKHLNGAIPFTSEAFTEAGRIVSEEGTQPTAVDALAIIKHANKKITISQTK